MLWMFAFFEQTRNGNGGDRTNGFTPVDQPLRSPFHVRPVRSGHVRRHSAEVAGPAVIGMAGDALSTVKDFNRKRGDACLDHLTDPGVRDAIAMLVHFNVVVDMNRDHLEMGHLIALHRQRLQRRRIEFREGAGAAARQLLEWTLIEPLE